MSVVFNEHKTMEIYREKNRLNCTIFIDGQPKKGISTTDINKLIDFISNNLQG